MQISLLYDNSTIPVLDPIVSYMKGYSLILINIDLSEQRHNNFNFNSLEQSIIVCVLDNDPIMRIEQFEQHNFSATPEFNDNTLSDKLIKFAVQCNIDNIGLILIHSNRTFKLYHLIHTQLFDVDILGFPKNDCTIYDKLFYVKRKVFHGDDRYVSVILDPPRAINVRSRNKDGKQVISMGGRDAYLASLIPIKINITMKLWTFRLSEYDLNEITES